MKFKKIKIISLIFLIVALCLLGFNIYKKSNNTNEAGAAKISADLSFVVMGDVHDNEQNFKDAVDDFYKINPNLDALVLNGDNVDQGLDSQYESVKSMLQKNSNKLPDTIIKNIGNHEFYNYDESSSSEDDIKNFTNKYLDFAGTDKVYHDTWIKGYHFISLGSDSLTAEDLSSTQASISDEQFEWLKEKLSEDYVEGKPIFVFLHQPMTVDFFGRQWSGVKQEDKLKNILNDYKEVFIFSSHTHKNFDDSIKEDMNFTEVHTGAVGYTLEKVETGGNDFGAQRNSSDNNALYIEVKNNTVTLNGRDVKNKNWVYSKEINCEEK